MNTVSFLVQEISHEARLSFVLRDTTQTGIKDTAAVKVTTRLCRRLRGGKTVVRFDENLRVD